MFQGTCLRYGSRTECLTTVSFEVLEDLISYVGFPLLPAATKTQMSLKGLCVRAVCVFCVYFKLLSTPCF